MYITANIKVVSRTSPKWNHRYSLNHLLENKQLNELIILIFGWTLPDISRMAHAPSSLPNGHPQSVVLLFAVISKMILTVTKGTCKINPLPCLSLLTLKEAGKKLAQGRNISQDLRLRNHRSRVPNEKRAKSTGRLSSVRLHSKTVL